MRRLSIQVSALGGVLLVPALAHAEVLDKEPTLLALWLCGAVTGVVGYLACRVHPVMAVLTLPLPCFFLAALAAELLDPAVGPELQREGGPAYVTRIVCAAAAALVGHVLGAVAQRSRRRPPTVS